MGALRAQASRFQSVKGVREPRLTRGRQWLCLLLTRPLPSHSVRGGRRTRSTGSQKGLKCHRDAGPHGPHGHVPRYRQRPGAAVACTVSSTCQVAGRGMKEVTEGAEH